MWKLLVAFVVFAAVALFALKKSGGNVDMGGEKHEVAPAHATEPASAASAPAAPASAASAAAPASAASH